MTVFPPGHVEVNVSSPCADTDYALVSWYEIIEHHGACGLSSLYAARHLVLVSLVHK